jgi:hypothetical protein
LVVGYERVDVAEARLASFLAELATMTVPLTYSLSSIGVLDGVHWERLAAHGHAEDDAVRAEMMCREQEPRLRGRLPGQGAGVTEDAAGRVVHVLSRDRPRSPASRANLRLA